MYFEAPSSLTKGAQTFGVIRYQRLAYSEYIFNNDVSKVIYHRSCHLKCQRIIFAIAQVSNWRNLTLNE